MSDSISKAAVRAFKAQAQRLEATVFLGKAGVTPGFLASVDHALKHQELIKIKFAHFKDERETLAAEIAEKTGAHLITIVGHVAVLYRKRPGTAGEGEAPVEPAVQ